jgi:hypothetical protein
MDCGCDNRKDVIFLHGGASGLDVAIILGVPVGILVYLWLKRKS